MTDYQDWDSGTEEVKVFLYHDRLYVQHLDGSVEPLTVDLYGRIVVDRRI